jgi:phage-related protein
MGKVGNWINEHIIQPVINFFQGLWDKIKTGVSNAWNFIVSILSKVSGWINEHIIQPVGSFFSNLWNGFKDGAINAWNGIKNIFSTIAGFFQRINKYDN